MAMPGDNTEMTVKLIQPIAMAEGLRFAIREGGRTVGAGRVIKILKYAIGDRSNGMDMMHKIHHSPRPGVVR